MISFLNRLLAGEAVRDIHSSNQGSNNPHECLQESNVMSFKRTMRKMDDSDTEQELTSVDCDGSGLHLLPGKLKVLILGSEWSSSKGGLSAINRELTINLAKCPEVHVSFYVPQCSDEEVEAARYHNIDLIKAERRPGMAELQWLLSPPPDLHIDVVVGHGVDLGPQAQFIREVRKCKWIQVVHKNPEETGMFRTGLDAVSESEKEHEDEVALCKEADFVLTVGPKLTEAFRAYLRSSNQTIFEFTPGILQDVSKVHQVPEEGNKFRVLLCGRGDTKDFSLQGFDIAAKAVALSDSHLVYVGAEGNENELKKRFLECEISAKSLTIRSTLKNRESLNELLCEVDLAVMPTRSDGFGVIGLEALSAGLPVLVSRNSGFGEALIKVSFGSSFVIDLEDVFDDTQVVQEWTKMIKKVKGKDRSQRLEESEALRTFYEKKYSWEKQSKDLVREIIKMIQEAPIGCHCSTQHKMSQQTGGPEDVSEHLPGTLQMEFSLKSATFQEAQTGHLESVMLEMARHFIDTVAAKIPAESMPESFYYYLAGVRDVEVKRASHGSLRVTVQCKTPDVLDSLWKDYRSGNLNAEAERRLLTDDIKKRFRVVSVKLQTTIRLVDYLACKLFLTSFPQSDEDQTTDETQTQLVEEPEPVTQHADVKCSTDNKALAPGGYNQLQTEENELKLTKKQIHEQQGQEEQLTQEQNPATKVQIHFETENKQSETMREQLNECQERELLRQEQNRVTELRSQLRTMKEELEITRKELNKYQGQEQLLKEQQRLHQFLLNASQCDLIETRRLLTKLQKQVHELQSQLQTREQDRDATRKQLMEYQEQVRRLHNQLRTREQDLNATRRQLMEYQEQVRRLQSQLQTREQDLDAARRQLMEYQEQVRRLHNQLRTREQDLDAARRQLMEYQEQVNRLQSQLQTREQDLDAARRQLMDYQEQVNRLQSQLRTREQDLDTTKKRLREHKEQERLLKEKQQQIYELQEQLSEQEQEHVHELESLLQTREQDLEATARRLREYQEQVRELHVRLAPREQDLEATRRRVREYQEQGELLKEQQLPYKLQQKLSEQQQQQQVNELQSQLRTREQDVEATKIRLGEYQEQVHELQQKLENKIWKQRVKREFETKSETRRWFTKKDYLPRQLLRQQQPRGHQEVSLLRGREKELETTTERQKRLLQPLKQQEQGVSQLQSQLQTIYPRNWIIHRDDVQFSTALLLSEGAWGPVYWGRFRGRKVAVKQMLPVRLPDDTRGFFERQADIASKCHHPRLLEFIGATADDQPPLFVTELMGRDCSLKTRLYPEHQRVRLSQKPLSLTEEDVTVISLDVAQALNYLHQKPLPIIHHNISSGKVLLWQRDEQWRAKVSGYETMNFVRKSSIKEVRYRAPELLTDDPPQPISCKVDVYSFGVLLCEMSIRQEPDPQKRRMQIAQIINRHFRELVQHCVKEEPEERPNMEEVIEDLRNLISLHHPNLLLKLGKLV